jgi:hypothetical protein
MKKSVVLGLALAVLVAAGGLYASNMAFKLNYTLRATTVGVSLNGTNTLALPFNQQTNLVTAGDLLTDIGGTVAVARISRFVPATNATQSYDGVTGTPFALTAAEAYFVQLKPGQTRQYIVVGSHDPSKVVQFNGPGPGSATGQNFYAWPYHSTSNDAGELISELGGTSVISRISRFAPATNSTVSYDGVTGAAFALTPGEGYFVQLKVGVPNVQFIPSHF